MIHGQPIIKIYIAQSVCYVYDTKILGSHNSHHIPTQARPQFKDLFWPHITVSSKVFQIVSGVAEYSNLLTSYTISIYKWTEHNIIEALNLHVGTVDMVTLQLAVN